MSTTSIDPPFASAVGQGTHTQQLRRRDDPVRPRADPGAGTARAGGACAALAPPGPMASAARAFGDVYPPITRHWLVRGAGLAYLLAALVYVPWLVGALNHKLPWLSWPFLVANLFTLLTTFLSVANHWSRAVPEPHPLPHGDESTVGIIVPCCGEPVGMILRTISSIIRQDWPRERMVIVVSDDGHDPTLALALQSWPVIYHSPPPRFAPGRDGAAKAGNLNSAFAMLLAEYPEIGYIETRDCDDELGSDGFLRQAVGQLEHDERLAYVQTIKEAQVSAGDPSTIARRCSTAGRCSRATLPTRHSRAGRVWSGAGRR